MFLVATKNKFTLEKINLFNFSTGGNPRAVCYRIGVQTNPHPPLNPTIQNFCRKFWTHNFLPVFHHVIFCLVFDAPTKPGIGTKPAKNINKLDLVHLTTLH